MKLTAVIILNLKRIRKNYTLSLTLQNPWHIEFLNIVDVILDVIYYSTIKVLRISLIKCEVKALWSSFHFFKCI